MDKISIVVPVYNTSKYLKKCLNSLVKQSYENIEIIVVDDGSPDDSYKIYQKFAEQDNRVKFIRKENAGVSEARNTGIDNATGDFIMFVDSDDWMELDGCQVLIDEYYKSKADLVLADVYCTNESGSKKSYCKVFKKEFSYKNREFIKRYQMSCLGYAYNPFPVSKSNVSGLGSPWNKLFKASIIKKNSLRYDSYVMGIYDDNLFTLHYLSNCKSVSYVSKPVYNYVSVSSSLTHAYKSNTIDISRRIFCKIEEFINSQKEPAEYYKPYYMYVIRRLSRELDTYYFPYDDSRSWPEIKEELKRNLSSSPYLEAIKHVESRRLMMAHWFVWIGARLNSPFVIKLLYKIRSIVKKLR